MWTSFMIYEREASKSLTKAGLSIIQQSWLLGQLLMGAWGGYAYFLLLLGKSSIDTIEDFFSNFPIKWQLN